MIQHPERPTDWARIVALLNSRIRPTVNKLARVGLTQSPNASRSSYLLTLDCDRPYRFGAYGSVQIVRASSRGSQVLARRGTWDPALFRVVTST